MAVAVCADAAHNAAFQVSADHDGATGLAIGDGETVRAALFTTDRRDIGLQLCDRHGHPRLEIMVDSFGRPLIGWHRRYGERFRVFRFDGRW